MLPGYIILLYFSENIYMAQSYLELVFLLSEASCQRMARIVSLKFIESRHKVWGVTILSPHHATVSAKWLLSH